MKSIPIRKWVHIRSFSRKGPLRPCAKSLAHRFTSILGIIPSHPILGYRSLLIREFVSINTKAFMNLFRDTLHGISKLATATVIGVWRIIHFVSIGIYHVKAALFNYWTVHSSHLYHVIGTKTVSNFLSHIRRLTDHNIFVWSILFYFLFGSATG